MGIFSRRKDLKKATDVSQAAQSLPALQLSIAECSLPEFEAGTATMEPSTPSVAQRPCLKPASQSENSIYLTMYAANNRLNHSSRGNAPDGLLPDQTKPSSRSSSTSRTTKQVSFKLDDKECLPRPKPSSSSGVKASRKPSPDRRSSYRLSATHGGNELDEWHDARSDTSSSNSVSSWNTGQSLNATVRLPS